MKHLFKILSLCTLYLVLSTGISAQNVIITDDNTYTPTSTNALLEVKPGSNDKGVLIPRLTSTERTAITMSAAADKGLLVYDTDTKSFWYYDGTAWVEIGATSSGMADDDGDTKIQVEELADEDNIRFDVAGTEAVVIDENANIGIGTDDPQKDLHIRNSGDVSLLLEADSDNSGEGDQPELIFSQDGGLVKTYLGNFNEENSFSIIQTYNEDIQFFTDSTLRMAVKGNGKVEIGAYTLPSNDGTNGQQLITDGSGNVSWSSSDPYWAASNGNIYRNSGNVGIGTSSPTSTLEISGSALSGTNKAFRIGSGFGDGGYIDFGDHRSIGVFSGGNLFMGYNFDYDASTDQYVYSNSSASSATEWTTSGEIKFKVASMGTPGNGINPTTAMMVANSGKVGIATSSPSALLEVSQQGGTFVNEAVDQQQTTSNSAIYVFTILWQSFTAGNSGYLSKVDLWDGGSSSGTFIMKIYQGQGTAGTLIGTSNSVSRSDSGSEYVSFTFQSSIQVSVSQQYTFAVEVSGTKWHLDYHDNNPYNGGVLSRDGNLNSSYDNRFKTYVATSYYEACSFVVKDNGTVGIGTTTPSQKLEVDGNILQTDGDYTATDQVRAIDGDGLKLYDDGGNGIFVEDGGNIGIGTNNPTDNLHISGSGDVSLLLEADTDNNGEGDQPELIFSQDGGTIKTRLGYLNSENNFSISQEYNAAIKILTNNTERLTVNGSGNVGIGTSSPTCPLEVNGSSNLSDSYGFLNSSGTTGTGSGSNPYSIKASDRIMASEFNAVSDQRIKTNINNSNLSTDLEKVKQLRLTHYNYIDSISKDRKQQKGFIAQEVEKVLPEAVNISSGFVPDIFVLATKIENDGDKTIIETPKEHKLQKGDQLRLITPAGQIDTEVTEVSSAQSFAVNLDGTPESIFVYGKKVDDFRVVNYDYIFSTGIGAIQELSLKVEKLESLQAEVEELKAMLGGSLQSAVDSRQ